MNVFFSWSGELSENIANKFKNWIMEYIFFETKIDIFVSNESVEFGTDWYEIVKEKLDTSDLAIVFITNENQRSSWLNFEAGHFVANRKEKRVFAFLIDIEIADIQDLPLSKYQNFNLTLEKLTKLMIQISESSKENTPRNLDIERDVKKNFNELKEYVDSQPKEIDKNRLDAVANIYPKNTKYLKRNKVFIGAPMDSVSPSSYKTNWVDALKLKTVLLEECGVKDIFYPGETLESGDFDGQEKSIRKNFIILKESEHYLFLYPEKAASSTLMEIGYAIALSKNMIIYTKSRSELPFMLQHADKVIANLKIYEYEKFSDFLKYVSQNGNQFLEWGNSNE